jgi:hypothetical protein
MQTVAAPKTKLILGEGKLYNSKCSCRGSSEVEQRTENPRVGGSTPPLGTRLSNAEVVQR